MGEKTKKKNRSVFDLVVVVVVVGQFKLLFQLLVVSVVQIVSVGPGCLIRLSVAVGIPIHYYCSSKKIHQMSTTLIWNLCNSQYESVVVVVVGQFKLLFRLLVVSVVQIVSVGPGCLIRLSVAVGIPTYNI